MRFVALKSEEQQAVLSLHRMRAQQVKIRAMQAYQVRSLLYEFGVVAPKGFAALKAKAATVLAEPTGCPVPELARVELLSQLEGLQSLTARMEALERRIGSWQQPRSRVRAARRHPRRGPADGHRGGGDGGRCAQLPLRP